MGDFGEDSDDSDGEGGMGNVNRIIMRPPGHSGKAKRGHLCFDASFETGNLGRVDLINEFEYDLFIRPDTCCPKLRFWFNFTVDNVRLDQRVIFNIVNISKGRNLFNTSMVPLVKSSSRNKWQRIPKRLVFYHKSPSHKYHYVLSFAFIFDKEDDIYQFALSFPYGYNRFQSFLTALDSKTCDLGEAYKRESIGLSIQKRNVEVITIGNKPPDKEKHVVVILGRIHAGESPSSFVCQGLIELLISPHPIAKLLREHIMFVIIPMLNPDGVYLGNYRSSLIGADLNRTWHRASPFAHPTLTCVIDFLTGLEKSKEYQVDFIIDVHAHSTLLGNFIYGNTYDDVYRYERHSVFPKLLAKVSDDFERRNCMYNGCGTKAGSARRFFCSAFNPKMNCYTFEVSQYGYKLKNSDVIIPYTEESYKRCGRNLLRAFMEYYHVMDVLPTNLAMELRERKRVPKTYRRPRSESSRPKKMRPSTTRIAAPLHYKDISIFYDSETSIDEDPSSFRVKTSPRKSTLQHNSREFTHKIQEHVEPSLSIIDFNIVTKDELLKAKIKKNP